MAADVDQADLLFLPAYRDYSSKLQAPLPMEQALTLTQRELSQLVDREAHLALLESAPSQREKARLMCLAREGAGDWLTALPSCALGLHLRPQEFVMGAKYRLGIPFYRSTGTCPARS